MLRLGSLFSGSGGFELAGCIHGVVPVWSSEIEPFPLRVEKLRFPNCKQLGSVTDINGAEIEPVDIITFGSPCQDLSVAGKQAGIHDGERSSLFFEAVRIIREMREHDRAIERTDVDIRPRFAVWENVPGAFSSNKGADFQAVLQALCEIEGGCGVSVPMPPKGKWLPAGCVVGNGYSVAWRIYDAQYWGVPQRRKRIYLIADFATERAGEILFECEGVSGDHQQGEPAGEGIATDAEGSTGRSHYACGGIIPYEESYFAWTYRGRENGCNIEMQKDIAYCLREPNGGGSQPNICYKADEVKCLNPWDVQSKHIMTPEAQSEALCSGEKRWGALPPNVCYAISSKQQSLATSEDNANTLGANDYKEPQTVCYAIDPVSSNSMKSSNPHSGFHEEDVARTLDTRPDPTCNQGGNVIVEPAAFMGGQGAKARSIAYCDDGTTPTIKSMPSGGNTIPDVCYPINMMVATRHNRDDGRTTFGIGEEGDPQFTLQAAHEHAVCYSIEGNTVDRDTKKNGCGYCQDVSPTLNTQDKHAVTYAIEGNGQRESHKGDGYKETDTMYTLNATENHAVCYPDIAKTLTQRYDSSPCIDRGQNIICYGVDFRNGVLDEEKTHTIQAKPNGGFSLNCTPSAIYNNARFAEYAEGIGTLSASGGDCGGGGENIVVQVYPIENHPADSRCDLMKGDKCQTLTSRMGTGGNNVPMILEIKDEQK